MLGDTGPFLRHLPDVQHNGGLVPAMQSPSDQRNQLHRLLPNDESKSPWQSQPSGCTFPRDVIKSSPVCGKGVQRLECLHNPEPQNFVLHSWSAAQWQWRCVTFVVTIHTTRFDIRIVHRIIIFLWEVTQSDVPTIAKERPVSVFGVP